MTQPRPCPDGAVLVNRGEHFPCDFMDQMSPDSTTHDGWGHSNRAAEAVWGLAEPEPSQEAQP